ncbi:MAG: hypothetical protein ACI8VT_002855, partial [Saprospiraceae bacterium]
FYDYQASLLTSICPALVLMNTVFIDIDKSIT